MYNLIISILLTLVLITDTSAECNENTIFTTPNIRFTIFENGTVYDKKSNLVWQRCSLGQTWLNANCNGDASTHSWEGAFDIALSNNFNNQSNWRLPNIKELHSIVEYACYLPSVNAVVFPNTPNAIYLTSSHNTYNDRYAWGVNFTFGNDEVVRRYNSGSIRLVRDVITTPSSGVITFTNDFTN